MKEDYRKWYSRHLGRDIEMLVYGHWGYPILIFPTTRGRYYEAKDQKFVEAARRHVEAGRVKLYCIDGIDNDSWFARHLPPGTRIYNHTLYDRMVNDELVPQLQKECSVDKIGVTGCSWGGYQALNFAFRHPDKVAHLWTMGAAFDVRRFMRGYYDDNVFYNNPPDYMPGAQNDHFYRMDIVLGTSAYDFCRPETEQMSQILSRKHIPHWLDIKPWGEHDWPVWREQFAHYLDRV